MNYNYEFSHLKHYLIQLCEKLTLRKCQIGYQQDPKHRKNLRDQGIVIQVEKGGEVSRTSFCAKAIKRKAAVGSGQGNADEQKGGEQEEHGRGVQVHEARRLPPRRRGGGPERPLSLRIGGGHRLLRPPHALRLHHHRSVLEFFPSIYRVREISDRCNDLDGFSKVESRRIKRTR